MAISERVKKSKTTEFKTFNNHLSLPKLIELTSSKNGNDRRLAASSLGKLSKFTPEIFQAVPHLIRLLGDKKPQVRQYATKALSKIGDARAIPHIKKLLSNEK